MNLNPLLSTALVPLTLATLALALALAIPATCHAQQTQALRAHSLAAQCAQCHGTEGRALNGAAVPGLAGMPAPYLVAQMKSFKDGTRAGSVMPQLAKGFSDAQIDTLAAFFVAQKK